MGARSSGQWRVPFSKRLAQTHRPLPPKLRILIRSRQRLQHEQMPAQRIGVKQAGLLLDGQKLLAGEDDKLLFPIFFNDLWMNAHEYASFRCKPR